MYNFLANTSMNIGLYILSEKDRSDWIWGAFGLIFGCPQVDLCCDVDNVEELFRFIGRDTPDMLEALEVDEATELDDDILDKVDKVDTGDIVDVLPNPPPTPP